MSGTTDHSGAGIRLSTVSDSVHEFWLWWVRELAEMLPERLRTPFRKDQKKLFLELLDGHCRLLSIRGNQSSVLNEFSTGEDSDSDAVAQRRALAGMTDEVVLRLPEHYLLRKTIALPLATQNKLADVLGFEMDRNTPFKAEEVYFTYRILSRDKAQQKVQVEVVIVTRAVLDELLQKLRYHGIPPTHVIPADTDLKASRSSDADLLSCGKPPAGKVPHFIHQKLWFIAAMLVVLIGGAFYQRHQQQIALQEALVEPRAEAEQAKELRDQLTRLQQGRQLLVSLKQQETPRLIVLDELTALLPDSTWLTRMSIEGEQLTLQGESENASALIATLEAAALFSNVSFASPVTLNPRSQKERFTISAELLSGPQQSGGES